ncbi:MAG: hypothetical protein ACD_50C00083G0017 [uncultured bacterium]|nr:MAG: hypothetical protein ACD_50C00083G0017 [uncultured bacterium]
MSIESFFDTQDQLTLSIHHQGVIIQNGEVSKEPQNYIPEPLAINQ